MIVSNVAKIEFSTVKAGFRSPVIGNLITAALTRNKSLICTPIPEFAKLNRAQNNLFHKYYIDEHTFEYINCLSNDPAISNKLNGEFVLAALLHDIAKPQTETIMPDGKSQYLGHAEKAAKEIVPAILTRLDINDGDPARDIILALIETHMRSMQFISQAARGELSDKAAGRFARDVVEPLKLKNIDLSVLLAFGRADLLASKGPECYSSVGVAENDNKALTDKIDQVITEIIKRIEAYYLAQKQSQDSKPTLVTGKDLAAAGYKPGPIMKELLAEAARLEKEGKNKDQIIAGLKQKFPV